MTDDRRSEMESLIRDTTGGYEFIGGGSKESMTAAITEWIDNGFGDDAESWWDAGCFDGDRAAEMRDAGLSPGDVGGDCPRYPGYSWGYARCNSDVSLADVIAACED